MVSVAARAAFLPPRGEARWQPKVYTSRGQSLTADVSASEQPRQSGVLSGGHSFLISDHATDLDKVLGLPEPYP